MPKLSKEAKQRLQHLFKGGQFAIRWGFIPVVLYLGFKRGADPGMPEPTVLRDFLGTIITWFNDHSVVFSFAICNIKKCQKITR